jgi:16S rRNA (guanine527-N7)-methyltransferase
MGSVTPARIVELLNPFQLSLGEFRLNQISTYIDLLIRWNARINLTAIRDPEEIVTRHFGESLFAANCLFDPTNRVEADVPLCPATDPGSKRTRLIDVGSGPGFPGLPIKLWNPSVEVTLIESNQKKATFLREVIRTLTLTNINVFSARAETHPPAIGDVVTLRAVERFEQVLPTVVTLVAPKGRIALLIGSAQVEQTRHFAPNLEWNPPVPIPQSSSRVILVAQKFDEPRQ